MNLADERRLRLRIMDALAEAALRSGGEVSHRQLDALDIGGGQVRRVRDTSRGIWNPQDLAATLSIVSSPTGPYDDSEVVDGLFHYAYRAGSLDGDNAKLRAAIDQQLPLILLRKLGPGRYLPVMPVYAVFDDAPRRRFLIALDENLRFLANSVDLSPLERRYAERLVQQRLHQPEFRARVIHAYQTRCAVCTLRHGDLLDAAHIIGDTLGAGDPLVTNGLSLCKIHHAAYDRNLLGISPGYTVHINQRLLDEIDGPMLEHGLKGMHDKSLTVPDRKAERPDRDRLAIRFTSFLAAS